MVHPLQGRVADWTPLQVVAVEQHAPDAAIWPEAGLHRCAVACL